MFYPIGVWIGEVRNVVILTQSCQSVSVYLAEIYSTAIIHYIKHARNAGHTRNKTKRVDVCM